MALQIPWTSWPDCKIESADKTHTMELKGVKKMTDEQLTSSNSPELSILRNKPLDISQLQYLKLVDQYKKIPDRVCGSFLTGLV